MSFLKQIGSASIWLWQVLKTLLSVKPKTTLIAIIASASRILIRIALRLLPLKLLVIAGSPGVPAMFSSYMRPEDKGLWIFSLCVGIAVCHAAVYLLDAAVQQTAKSGSSLLLSSSDQLALSGSQETHAQGFYATFIELYGNVLFFVVVMVAVAATNPLLFLTAVALIVIELLFTAAVLGAPAVFGLKAFKRLILEKRSAYLTILRVLNIVAVLAFLVAPLALDPAARINVPLAVVSFYMIVRSMTALISAIGGTLSLVERRPLISMLLLRRRETDLAPQDKGIGKELRVLFSKPSREKLVADAMIDIEPGSKIASRWMDSTIAGLRQLKIIAERPDGTVVFYQQQIFPPRYSNLQLNERLLFDHVPRKALLAPPLRIAYRHGQFECQIVDYGLAKPEVRATWKSSYLNLLEKIWAVRPPDELVEIYQRTHQFLFERLSTDMISRMRAAVDDADDEAVMSSLEAKLENIQAALKALPLVFSTPDMLPGNSIATADGGHYVMSWGRWTVDAIGMSLSPYTNIATVTGLIQTSISSVRQDLAGCGENHLLLARDCLFLERAILTERFKAALAIAAELLDNPLIGGTGGPPSAVALEAEENIEDLDESELERA